MGFQKVIFFDFFFERVAKRVGGKKMAVATQAVREKERKIGSLYPYYYVTTGMVMPIEIAKRFGREISKDLLQSGVQATLLTST